MIAGTERRRQGCSLQDGKQWGYGNSESTQTFPIKFTNSVIGIYGSKRAINYEYTFAATSITNTSFQINYGGPILYLAIGKA